MKFRKKPVVIDAVQWFKQGDHPGVITGGKIWFMFDNHTFAKLSNDPDKAALEAAKLFGEDNYGSIFVRDISDRSIDALTLHGSKDTDFPTRLKEWAAKAKAQSWPAAIETLEGNMEVTPGDWIIRGIKGELYPCKPDIFAATYEPA
jgi:hypothetical protein